MKKSKFLIWLPLLIVLGSCKKLVDIPPPVNAINSSNVYTNDGTAAAVLDNIYANMSSKDQQYFGIPAAFEYLSLSADELTLYDKNNLVLGPYYRNNLTANSPDLAGFDYWSITYPNVIQANDAIQGLSASGSLTSGIRQQLLGEAYFVRAYCYFYLVNLYGDVPLITGIDYKANATVSRTPKDQVWQQIISDLKQAIGLMRTDYLGGDAASVSIERTRPTKWAAEALLARAALYINDNAAAISASTDVINSGKFSLNSLNDVFVKNSNETIWSLQPVLSFPSSATGEGILFNLPSSGPNNDPITPYPVYLSDQVLNAFEPGDQRRTNWVNQVVVGGITYHYANKYKADRTTTSLTEYAIQFRLGEQYLIRAEAEMANNDLAGSVRDLNIIRTRAGLPAYAGVITAAALKTAISHERQVELFTENGHRWLDLKRTGTIDAVMAPVTTQKGGTWSSYKQLFPIIQSQLSTDVNLKQNPGY